MLTVEKANYQNNKGLQDRGENKPLPAGRERWPREDGNGSPKRSGWFKCQIGADAGVNILDILKICFNKSKIIFQEF